MAQDTAPSPDGGELGTVQRRVLLPAPVATVWAALTEAGHLSAWLGGEVELDPFPGGQIVVREDGRLRRGVIVDVEPLRHLEIRWLPTARRIGFLWGPDEEPPGSGGGVEFRLEPVGADSAASEDEGAVKFPLEPVEVGSAKPTGEGVAPAKPDAGGAARRLAVVVGTRLTVIERPPAAHPAGRPSALAVA